MRNSALCRRIVATILLAALAGCAMQQKAPFADLAEIKGLADIRGSASTPVEAINPSGGGAPPMAVAPPPVRGAPRPPAIRTAQTAPANGAPQIELVRYIGIDALDWTNAPAAHSLADLYTRIIVASDLPEGTTGSNAGMPRRDYVAEKRSWAAILSTRTDTVTTVANITLRDPGLTIAIPLFSITHASGRQLGNTWDTLFTASSVESPLFRLSANTGLTLHVSAKVSSDVKSQGAALAVSALTTAVKIAAPTSTLLTTLSKPATDNTAAAIDSAISSLLSESISEDIEMGRLAAGWSPASALEITGCAPFVHATGTADTHLCGSEGDLKGVVDQPVGTWRLFFACPRLSVFDSKDICDDTPTGLDESLWQAGATKLAAERALIARTVSDAQILSFNLSSETTVQAYVLAQPWFTSFVALSTRKPADYASFCASGLVALEANGLNTLDAALVIRAMIERLPQMAALHPDFATGDAGSGCRAMIGDGVPMS